MALFYEWSGEKKIARMDCATRNIYGSRSSLARSLSSELAQIHPLKFLMSRNSFPSGAAVASTGRLKHVT